MFKRISLLLSFGFYLALFLAISASGCGSDDSMSSTQNPGALVDQGGDGTQVTEGGATDSYTISLTTLPSADVVITITPDAQIDLRAGPATAITLTFTSANATTPQTVTVRAVDDDVIEDDHTAVIRHVSTSGDNTYDNLQFNVAVEIVDNETSSDFATVQGTITFDNVAMWPDSGEVQVTIWAGGVWTSAGPMALPAADPFTLERVAGQTEYHYQFIALSEGVYSAIAVGWRHPDETLPPEERSAFLGVYLDDPAVNSTGLEIPNTPFQGPLPASFLMGAGSNEKGFDILADFANIALFFPSGSN